MYAKLISNKLTYAPKNFNTGDNLILNFNKNMNLMKKYGFKEVVDVKPNFDSSTHYLTVDNYIENEDNIIINYKLNEIVIDNTPTLEERVAELERINQELMLLMKSNLIKEGEK